jgi:beta-mannosidase
MAQNTNPGSTSVEEDRVNSQPEPERFARASHPVTGFEFVDTAVGADLPAEPVWLPAVVPGGVHESLLAAGLMMDPYVDRNENFVRWIEDRDWWFRAAFTAPPDLAPDERLRLICYGLDTVAALWLNAEPLGEHVNMFRPAIFDLAGQSRSRNELLIRFSPPLAGIDAPEPLIRLAAALPDTFADLAAEQPTETEAGSELPVMFSGTLARATLRRKAAFSWGWDFGPRVPSIGIWRPVELVHERRAVITGHHVMATAVDAEARTAEVQVRVEVDAFATGHDLTAAVELRPPAGRAIAVELILAARDGPARSARVSIHLDQAELWWTHDLGDQPLYAVRVSLREGDEVLDVVHDRIGLRTIELDRSPDPEGGRYFRFMLNGCPLFARGAAWLPASLLVGSVGQQRYRDLVAIARAGNFNMLRVWGGGIYEHEAFYAATDELGVLVWQDFMFACVDYPSEDEGLASEVALEAAYQVKRLRNRASIAVWAGNNEVHMLHQAAYHDIGPGNWGYRFFHELLPAAVADHGPGVPYWPGSPYGVDDPLGVNGVHDGDRHAWEVWHGIDFGTGSPTQYASRGEAMHFRRYADDTGKFISEFGIHASPELPTLRRWIPDSELTMHSLSIDHHNKDRPKNKGDALLEVETGLPDGIEQYVDFTMAAQAEGLKFGIEHYRRRQPSNSGTLIWQFNDVWPGFSWSVVDYDLVPKAGYYYAKRAFAPLLASFRRISDGRVELWFANSTAERIETEATVQLASFDGTVHTETTVQIEIASASAVLVWRSEAGYARPDRFAWVSSTEGMFPANRLFFDHLKNLPWPSPQLDVAVTPLSPSSATVSITASRFAYFVHVLSPLPGARFSNNYIDLRTGDTAVIMVEGLPDSFGTEQLIVKPYSGASS